MQYGIYETLINTKNLVLTKLFHRGARLIRYPVYLRNSKHIKFGKGFTCGYRCRLECVEDETRNGKILFGENVKIGDNVHIASASKVSIGDNCLFASNIFISDLDHGAYSGENQTSPNSNPDVRELHAKDVEIGSRVWLGENVVVLKGVTIGEGSIVGANTLVNKDVPDDSIVVGNPMRIIKRYNEDSKEWERVK